MIADFGYGVLVVTFLVALYSVFAAIYGDLRKIPALVESARRAMLLTWPLLTLTAGILIYLLINNHYEVQFVYEVTSRSMPTYLKVTAWWGGQAGSLLFWSWLMSAFASLVTLRKWDRDREFLPWVIVVASVTMAFFIGLNVFFENPFAQLYQTFAGINPSTFQACGWRSLHPHRWTWTKPASSPPGHDHPSPNALSWLRLFCHSVCVRHRCIDHGPHRRPLDTSHAPLGAVGMALPLLRTRAWKPLGV